MATANVIGPNPFEENSEPPCKEKGIMGVSSLHPIAQSTIIQYRARLNVKLLISDDLRRESQVQALIC